MKIRFKTSTQVRKVVGVVLLVCGLPLYGQQTASGAEAEAKAATYTTFNFTGSVYIQSMAINPAGTITGNYVDASSLYHGFLRARNGTFATFDFPVPGTGPQGTFPLAINPAGEVTGWYYDANFIQRGFLRIPARRDE